MGNNGQEFTIKHDGSDKEVGTKEQKKKQKMESGNKKENKHENQKRGGERRERQKLAITIKKKEGTWMR